MRWPARLAAVGAVTLVAVACREGPSSAVTLRVVNWAPELELALEQSIADRFAATRPGVRVVVESIVTNFGEKLITSIASGTPPDVFLLDVPDIPAFVERGLVLDLAPYTSRVGYDPSAVFPNVLAVFQRGERLFAFPKDFTPMVLYYNRRIFRARGVPVPPDGGWTREEFLDSARRLVGEVGDGEQPETYALNFPRNFYEWIPWAWSGCGDVVDGSDRRFTGHLDSPAVVDTFEFLTSLVERWKLTPPVDYTGSGDAARENRFVSGRQAMLYRGHWVLPVLLKHARRGQLDLGVAPVPHKAGCPSVNVIYVSGWAVPANVRHKRLAVELAAFMGGEEAARVRAASRIGIPSIRRLAAELAASDATGVERQFLGVAEDARMPWGAVIADFSRVERMIVDVMDRRLLSGADLTRAARDVAAALDEVMMR